MLQLAARGAAVRVLFLTDGGGARRRTAAADPGAYRPRRRAEAGRGGAPLGVAGMRAPRAARRRARRAARRRRCGDSPRAARPAAPAAARALAARRSPPTTAPPSRRSTGCSAACAPATSSRRSPRRSRSCSTRSTGRSPRPAGRRHRRAARASRRRMAAYASQEERHPYSPPALGLRRFRTLTLPPRRRGRRGLSRLAAGRLRDPQPRALWSRELGGDPARCRSREGPPVSVVVRTRDRPALLAEALASLAASSYRRLEVVLVNDGGAPPAVPADFPFPVVRVEHAASRGRAAAAANAGIAAATGDYVAFLDDDDLRRPRAPRDARRPRRAAAGVRVAYTDAAVGVYELDARTGLARGRAAPALQPRLRPRPAAGRQLHPVQHPARSSASCSREVGPLDESLPFFEDWDLLIRLARADRRSTTWRGSPASTATSAAAAPRLRRAAARARRLPGGQGAGARQARRTAGPRADAPRAAVAARRAATGEARGRAAGACAALEDAPSRARRARERSPRPLERDAALAERQASRAPARRGERLRAERAPGRRRRAPRPRARRARREPPRHLRRDRAAQPPAPRAWSRRAPGGSTSGWHRPVARDPVTRIALLSSEPIRPRDGRHRHPLRRARATAARRSGGRRAALPGRGRGDGRAAASIRRGSAASSAAGSPTLFADCDAVVAQGQLANDLLLDARPVCRWRSTSTTPGWSRTSTTSRPSGLDPYRNDHATWVLQLSRGDFFLCSSEEQRLFYLGFLAALGRVNPERVAEDPTSRGLIAPCLRRARRAAAHRPVLPPRAPGRAAAALRRPLRLVRPRGPCSRRSTALAGAAAGPLR